MTLYKKLHLGSQKEKQEVLNKATVKKALEHFSKKPENFLMGNCPFTGEPIWKTQDEHDDENPYKGLPHKEYIKALLNVYNNERIIIVEKSRQMIVSTLTCGYIAWESIFKNGRLWLISKTKEMDAIALMRDKIRGPFSRMPDWLQKECPMSKTPQNEILCNKSGSRILGVTENVANSSGRGMTASGFFLDEAAFQDSCRDIWASVMPMAKKLIAVTTPSLLPGGIFLAKKFEDAEGGDLLPEYMNQVRKQTKKKRVKAKK